MERERLKSEAAARRNAAPAIGIPGHRSEPPAAAASAPKGGKNQPPKPKKVKRIDKPPVGCERQTGRQQQALT